MPHDKRPPSKWWGSCIASVRGTSRKRICGRIWSRIGKATRSRIRSKHLAFKVAALVLFFPALAHAQFLKVSQFPGTTVGDKTARASQFCQTGMTCVLVIDPEMSAWAAGVLPITVPPIYIQDFRQGPISAGLYSNAITALAYGARFDARYFNDGATTNGQPTLTSATLNCTPSDVGKTVWVINVSNGTYPLGGSSVAKILSCTSSTVAITSANATASGTGFNWVVGTDDTLALQNGSSAAWNSGSSFILPCGNTVVTAPPFIFTTAQLVSQDFNITGCGSTADTTFILHPQITSTILTGGTVFYSAPSFGNIIGPAILHGPYPLVRNFKITGMGGNLPTTSGAFTVIKAPVAYNLMFDSMGFSGGGSCAAYLQNLSGETYYDRINAQSDSNGGSSFCEGVSMGGQGSNAVSNSIFAFLHNAGIACQSAVCDLVNDYTTQLGGSGNPAVFALSGSTLYIRGGVYTSNTTNPTMGSNGSGSNIFNLADTNISNASTGAAINLSSSSETLSAVGSKIVAGVFASSITGTGLFLDVGGNTVGGISATISLAADGHSVYGACTGTATASSTLGLYGTGPNVTLTTCTSTTVGSGSVVNQIRTLQNLVVIAGTGGVNASSGVFTVLRNGSTTTITCTLGTGTSCVDNTHTVILTAGDRISLQFTTQAAETLANVKATVEWN